MFGVLQPKWKVEEINVREGDDDDVEITGMQLIIGLIFVLFNYFFNLNSLN